MHLLRSTTALLTVLALAPALAAQQQPAGQAPAAPGTVVVSANICATQSLTRVNEFATQQFGPILDELVREGKLMGWGVLNHAWGDEYNWVIYYSAKDQATFATAFGEAVRRTNQRHPGAFDAILPLCSQHRDNIYSVVVARSLANLPAAPAPR